MREIENESGKEDWVAFIECLGADEVGRKSVENDCHLVPFIGFSPYSDQFKNDVELIGDLKILFNLGSEALALSDRKIDFVNGSFVFLAK